jgi:PAS domain S-box-containing protein
MPLHEIETDNLLRVFTNVLENAFNPIVITSAQDGYPVIFANQPFCDMTGYTASELYGHSLKILQGPETNQAVISRMHENLKKGMPFHGAAINYRKDGTPYSVEWNITAIKNSSGEIAYFQSTQRDVSKLKNVFTRIKKKNEHFRSFLLDLTAQSNASTDKNLRSYVEERSPELVSEVLSDAVYYNRQLRDDREKEQFEDSEFFDFSHNLQGILADPMELLKISAQEYAEQQTHIMSSSEVLNLLEEALTQIELLPHSSNPTKDLKALSETLKETASILFYLEEFIGISSALNELAEQTYQSAEKEWPPFIGEVYAGLINDLVEWTNRIFVDKTATDIHYLDASIISSCKQVIAFVK